MTKVRLTVMLIAALVLAAVPLSSQTEQKPSFEVVSVKPSPPMTGGPIRIGGGAQGDRFVMASATLRMLLQTAYQRSSNTPLSGQLQIIGGPGWMESDRYDVQARADCSSGAIPRERLQLMVQSMLEDRFQLKAHMETRELPIYNLMVAKDGPKIKPSDDQTPLPFAAAGPPRPCDATSTAAAPPAPPPPPPGGRGGAFPFDPGRPPPRGSVMMSSSPTGMTLQATAMPVSNLVGLLQQQLGRTIVDKTNLKGLFDFKLTYSPEGLSSPFGRGGLLPPPGGAPAGPSPVPAAADPVPSIFTALQELGLRLESSKGPVEVLVIESVQKPTEN
jgi:uncharacterized protein (TIGR03435 family)